MSVWNIHDIRAGHRAIELIKGHGGSVNLGLRPFNYPKEHASWLPCLGAQRTADQLEILVAEQPHSRHVTIQGMQDASPVWVMISEGQIISVRYGQLADAEIEVLISQLLIAH
jgi:hypothetical protein